HEKIVPNPRETFGPEIVPDTLLLVGGFNLDETSLHLRHLWCTDIPEPTSGIGIQHELVEVSQVLGTDDFLAISVVDDFQELTSKPPEAGEQSGIDHVQDCPEVCWSTF